MTAATLSTLLEHQAPVLGDQGDSLEKRVGLLERAVVAISKRQNAMLLLLVFVAGAAGIDLAGLG